MLHRSDVREPSPSVLRARGATLTFRKKGRQLPGDRPQMILFLLKSQLACQAEKPQADVQHLQDLYRGGVTGGGGTLSLSPQREESLEQSNSASSFLISRPRKTVATLTG